MPLSTLKLLLAWLWFFILLLSYYILKPIRDGIGSILSKELDFWYLSTFVVIVISMAGYARLVRFLKTRWLIFSVYQGCAICLLVFVGMMRFGEVIPKWQAGIFFVWVSVFNLCSVALFWSVMADLYSRDEGERWFGILAGAGSVGALFGSGITIQATQFVGHRGLLLLSFAGIELSFVLAWWVVGIHRSLTRASAESAIDSNAIDPGTTVDTPGASQNVQVASDQGSTSLWQGFLRILGSPYLLAICLFVVLGKFSATFLYNNLQSVMLFEIASSERRTQIFAQMNFTVQIGSMVLQYLLVSWLFRFIGVGRVLAIPCVVMMFLFGSIYIHNSLLTLVVAQVVQQIMGYGLMTPGQNLLFTVVPRHDKYVSKGFIDTVVFRFSDVLASKLCTLLQVYSSLTLGVLSLYLMPVLIVWLWISQRLGRQFRDASRLPA